MSYHYSATAALRGYSCVWLSFNSANYNRWALPCDLSYRSRRAPTWAILGANCRLIGFMTRPSPRRALDNYASRKRPANALIITTVRRRRRLPLDGGSTRSRQAAVAGGQRLKARLPVAAITPICLTSRLAVFFSLHNTLNSIHSSPQCITRCIIATTRYSSSRPLRYALLSTWFIDGEKFFRTASCKLVAWCIYCFPL